MAENNQNVMKEDPETIIQRRHEIRVDDNFLFRIKADVLNALGFRNSQGERYQGLEQALFPLNYSRSIWFPNFTENKEPWSNRLSPDEETIEERAYMNSPDTNWRQRKQKLEDAERYKTRFGVAEAPIECKTIYFVFGKCERCGEKGFRFLGVYEAVKCDTDHTPFITIWKRIRTEAQIKTNQDNKIILTFN